MVSPAFAAALPILPSQVTPEIIQAPLRGPAPDLKLPELTPALAPLGADTLDLTVGRIEITGGRPELAAQAEAIKTRFSGRRVALAELYAAAAELELAYSNAGFPLIRVTLPPQRLVPRGPVKLSVIDGYVETVDVSGVPPRFREFVRARVAGLVGKRGITAAEIERAVLLAGDAHGLTLKTAIATGDQAGGAKLIVEGTAQLVTGSVSIDNDLPATLGTWQSSISAALNGPLGLGEQEYLLLGTALEPQPSAGLRSPLSIFGFGVSVPVGTDGATLTVDYTRSLTRPHQQPGAPETIGHFDRAALRLDYPWIRDRQETLTVDASLDYIAQVNSAPQFATDLDRDQYGTFRLGASWQRTISDATTAVVRVQLSRGLAGRGPPDAMQIPLSRLGAAADFTKVSLDAEVSQRIASDLILQLSARGQYSFNAPVFVSEQFALDSSQGVSGYPSGTFSVDSGTTLRAELARPLNTRLPPGAAILTPYLFAAIGTGLLSGPSAAETTDPVVGSFGLGLRLDLQEGLLQGAGVRTEIAHHYSNVPGERSGNRFRVNIIQRF